MNRFWCFTLKHQWLLTKTSINIIQQTELFASYTFGGLRKDPHKMASLNTLKQISYGYFIEYTYFNKYTYFWKLWVQRGISSYHFVLKKKLQSDTPIPSFQHNSDCVIPSAKYRHNSSRPYGGNLLSLMHHLSIDCQTQTFRKVRNIKNRNRKKMCRRSSSVLIESPL